MSVVDIRAALEARLQSMADYLGDANTQWENTAFTPADAAYQSVYLLLADPINPEMGGYIQQQGYMQVTLRYPANKGSGDAAAQAQKIRGWFYKGLSLAANGFTVTINKTPTVSPGANDGDRYAVPVKIKFYANNAR